MTRVIEGLQLAWRLGERPPGLPVNRPRGSKRDGLGFERAVGEALPSGGIGGAWWAFRDSNGNGVCQTDWLLEGKRSVLVIECKLGQHWEAWRQIEKLYSPVVGRALGKPVFGVQVCKILRRDFRSPGEVLVHDLEGAIAVARTGRRPLLHWSGLGPLIAGNAKGHGILDGAGARRGLALSPTREREIA